VGGACGYRRQAGMQAPIWLVTHSLLKQAMPSLMQDADALIVDEALSPGEQHDELTVAELMAAREGPSPLATHILPRLDRALGSVAPGAFLPRAAFEAEAI